jgi:Uma2 family endonuclease
MLTYPTQHRPEGKFRMSFAEFNQLLEMDFFGEENVELLNGEVFIKGKQNPPHQQAVRHLTKLLERALGEQVLVSSQLPLVLESPPPDYLEPDIALLKLPFSNYQNRDATNQDALLVVEISDSTLSRDQGEKLAAYARNNIPEYWVLNLTAQRLEVYQKPLENEYKIHQIFSVGEAVEFLETSLEWWAA